MKKIVVIGATGHFGGRFCRRFVGESNTELTVASRNAESSETLASELRAHCPGAPVRAVALDHSGPEFDEDLRKLNPDIVPLPATCRTSVCCPSTRVRIR